MISSLGDETKKAGSVFVSFSVILLKFQLPWKNLIANSRQL
jgi:hypothetical protein